MREHHPDLTPEDIAAVEQRVEETRQRFAALTPEEQEAALARLIEERRKELGINTEARQ